MRLAATLVTSIVSTLFSAKSDPISTRYGGPNTGATGLPLGSTQLPPTGQARGVEPRRQLGPPFDELDTPQTLERRWLPRQLAVLPCRCVDRLVVRFHKQRLAGLQLQPEGFLDRLIRGSRVRQADPTILRVHDHGRGKFDCRLGWAVET